VEEEKKGWGHINCARTWGGHRTGDDQVIAKWKELQSRSHLGRRGGGLKGIATGRTGDQCEVSSVPYITAPETERQKRKMRRKGR